jgi:hypothetical protein
MLGQWLVEFRAVGLSLNLSLKLTLRCQDCRDALRKLRSTRHLDYGHWRISLGRITVAIPAGDVVTVITDPSDGRQTVDVLWHDHASAMFVIDLTQRGTEVPLESA